MSTNKRARNRVPLAAANSRDAKRTAAAILEVLAGLRSPPQAAEALGVSLPRYYQLETRGLKGLLEASEPKPRGRQTDPSKELTALQRENERLRREVGRQQSLVRAAQRTVGLGPAPPPAARPSGKKTRNRKPAARALNLAARLNQEAEAEERAGGDSSAPTAS